MKLQLRTKIWPKPTWKNQNTVKRVATDGLSLTEAKVRVTHNNKIAKVLKQHGWEFTEGVNITNGFSDWYSLHFRKRITSVPLPKKGSRAHAHPYVYFSFKWPNQGGDDFMEGEMYSFYNYAPEKKYMRPSAQFEIRHITESHLPLINDMFSGVVAAINSQIPSYGDSEDIN